MRALVTGANGFLGAWLTRELIRVSARVRCLVRRTSALAELSGLPVEVMYGDVVDGSSLPPAIEGCDVVFHLAGIRRAPSRRKTRQVRVGAGTLRALGTLADGASRVVGKNLPLNRKLIQQLLAPAWTCSWASNSAGRSPTRSTGAWPGISSADGFSWHWSAGARIH